jgi:hypothetical protein
MVDPALKGKVFPPFSYMVERGKLREFLRAIGDDVNKANVPDAIVPPTFATVFLFSGGDGLDGTLKEIGIDIFNVLHAEQEYEYFVPVRVGDTVTGQIEVKDVYTKGGRSGQLNFVELELAYKNQHDQPVLRETTIFVVRETGVSS